MNIISKIKNKKIGVLYGGWSPEREISIKSGKAVLKSLINSGCNAVGIDIKKNNLISEIKRNKIDIAFIALHGPFGEDGCIQSILELLGIPYTGSNVLASALAMNKIYSKKIFEYHGLPTPEWKTIKKDSIFRKKFKKDSIDDILQGLKFPVVVKPSTQGSAIGVNIARNREELLSSLRKSFKYDNIILLEKYIQGKELTVGILGEKILPVIEIVPNEGEFYNYNSKYSVGGSQHIIPARIPQKICSEAKRIAKSAFDCLGCSVVGRVDLRLSKENKLYLLEVNTIPGMTETSLLPDAAKKVNISFEELVLKIIEYSLNKK